MDLKMIIIKKKIRMEINLIEKNYCCILRDFCGYLRIYFINTQKKKRK